ncbi:MAG: chromosomal replication initiator protein DnaA [Clostridia bacterium]|nr:chromosomal replication initiator protein DnaA [Clostridia bacterium]
MEERKQFWETACGYIAAQIPEISFHKWIEPLSPVTVEHGILVLEAPDDVIKSTVQKFYLENVRRGVQKADPTILDLMLILSSQREDFLRVTEEPKEPQPNLSLNPKYTFDTFVVGKSNNFAHAAALAVADEPGRSYNPLFIYGGVGLGKTHLMHAIGHAMLDRNKNARIVYVTSEMFTNDLIEALRAGKNIEFRQKYRNIDLLMIDDVQFIAGKQSVQEEFFNTFNALHNLGKQIVISSDRPPKEIKSLEERLSSRFECGLVADIQPPDRETRIAILKNRALLEHVDVKDDVILYIAEHVQNNVRQLEGSLTRVIAYSRLKGIPITMSLALEALKDLLPDENAPAVTPDRIKETVASYYAVSVENLTSQRRDKEIVLPRQVAMYLCHKLLNLPYKKIAQLFDRGDHTTAISACKKIASTAETDYAFREELKNIEKRLENRS